MSDPTPAPAPVGGASPAGTFVRLVAFAGDLVLVSALIFAVAALLSGVAGPAVEVRNGTGGLTRDITIHAGRAAVQGVIAVALSALYFAASWRWFAATPVARLLRVRIDTGDGDAAAPRVGWRGAFVRWIVVAAPLSAVGLATRLHPVAGAALLLVTLLWYATLLWSTVRHPRRRGVHDRIAGTSAVSVRQRHCGRLRVTG